MKKLSLLNKFIFFINNVLALLLFLSILIPYIQPKAFPIGSTLSLVVPFLIFTHIIFVIYWLVIGVKKQFILSGICVLLTILFSYFPYKFNGRQLDKKSTLKVMSYNVHLFNKYDWIKNDALSLDISSFILQNNPDIIAFQEFYNSKDISLDYPYKYIKLNSEGNFGQAIYSKYKIINNGSLKFKSISNNAIFADIVKESDTIRVYSVHLESIGLKDEKDSEKILRRLASSFAKQQPQVEKLITHKQNCKYKVILCGDFNNTAYSWAYRKVKNDSKDTFLQAGKGFGKTFNFHNYPLRIDFIFVDKNIEVVAHQNFNVYYSDHEPIMAKLDF